AGLGDEEIGVVVAPRARPPAELGKRVAASCLHHPRRALDEGDQLLGRSRRREGRRLGLRDRLPLATDQRAEPAKNRPDAASDARPQRAHVEPSGRNETRTAYDRRENLVKVTRPP